MLPANKGIVLIVCIIVVGAIAWAIIYQTHEPEKTSLSYGAFVQFSGGSDYSVSLPIPIAYANKNSPVEFNADKAEIVRGVASYSVIDTTYGRMLRLSSKSPLVWIIFNDTVVSHVGSFSIGVLIVSSQSVRVGTPDYDTMIDMTTSNPTNTTWTARIGFAITHHPELGLPPIPFKTCTEAIDFAPMFGVVDVTRAGWNQVHTCAGSPES